MEKLLDKAKNAMSNTDLGAIIDDITNIGKILANPSKRYFD